jgi:hypothetical protein
MISAEELEKKSQNFWHIVLATTIVAVASFMYFVFSVNS